MWCLLGQLAGCNIVQVLLARYSVISKSIELHNFFPAKDDCNKESASGQSRAHMCAQADIYNEVGDSCRVYIHCYDSAFGDVQGWTPSQSMRSGYGRTTLPAAAALAPLST